MPGNEGTGRWQRANLTALAHQSPLRLWALLACGQARTVAARQAVTRACRLLVAQGGIARRARGLYALVVDLAAGPRAAAQ